MVTVKFETKDTGALELTREEEIGTLTRISNVLLDKEEKIFRHLINQLSIKQ